MLDLPTVTACCVDTRAPDLALAALARSAARVRFAEVVLLTDAARAGPPPPGVRVVDVSVPSAQAYSEFMIKGLAAHVRTPHVLVVQWDGFVLAPEAWDPAFLDYDYVGPRWPGADGPGSVGNGGFSLRSRALLDALLDPHVVPSHPEDVCICGHYRAWLEARGVRFAPPALADRFGFERTAPAGPTFGFHGLYNFPRALPADELRAFVRDAPAAVFGGREGKDLCKALVAGGRLGEAAAVLRRRAEAGARGATERRLAARLAWARLRRGWRRA